MNRASLERMLSQLEEKRREEKRERRMEGPRVRYLSRRNDAGDNISNTVTFVDCPLPNCIDGIAPPYPSASRCAVTGAPAKYFDPQTGQAYAGIEAFRQLRGRTGRRQQAHHFSGGAPATPGGSSAGGTPGGEE